MVCVFVCCGLRGLARTRHSAGLLAEFGSNCFPTCLFSFLQAPVAMGEAPELAYDFAIIGHDEGAVLSLASAKIPPMADFRQLPPKQKKRIEDRQS